MARLFTIDWGDGTAPQTDRPSGEQPLRLYSRKGVYQVKVTDQTTGRATTKQLAFPADFILNWTTTPTGVLGTWSNVIEVTTPPAVESITAARFDDRILSLSSVTKTAPGKFRISTQSLIGGEEATLTLEFIKGYTITCRMKVRAAGTGTCNTYAAPLALWQASNAGVLGLGRGTWLTPYAESGVAEVNLRWLNADGSPYDGQVIKLPTWRETGFAYWYGYKAELTVPGTNTKLVCPIGPDGRCSL